MPSGRPVLASILTAVVTFGLVSWSGAQPTGPNLLQNPGFTTDLLGWSQGAAVAWSPEDANGSGASGSARLYTQDDSVGPAISQCLPVTGGVRYRLGARVRWLEGTVNIQMLYHAQAGCQGDFHLPLVFAGPARRAVWRWVSVSDTAPVDAVSVKVVVGGGRAISPTVEAWVDDAYFEIESSTRFHTIPPCRLVAQTPIQTAGNRVFTVPELGCGVPASARALAANLTVISRDTIGHLGYYTAGPPPSFNPPTYSALNFGLGQTRAAFAVIDLNDEAEFALYVATTPVTSPVEVIVDVTGYFE